MGVKEGYLLRGGGSVFRKMVRLEQEQLVFIGLARVFSELGGTWVEILRSSPSYFRLLLLLQETNKQGTGIFGSTKGISPNL